MTAPALCSLVPTCKDCPHCGKNDVWGFDPDPLGTKPPAELVCLSCRAKWPASGLPHGTERNRRIETTEGPTRELQDARTGETFYTGPLCSSSVTVSERWCATCGRWVEVRGILGFIGWDVDHRHEPTA